MYFFAIEMTRRRFASTLLAQLFQRLASARFSYQNLQEAGGQTTILRFHRRHLLELA
jgi:hypothetical protein